MKKTLYILFIVIASVAKQAVAQNKIDSLLTLIKTDKEDTNKINTLNTLSFEYWDISPNEGLKYGKEALALAEKLQSKKDIAAAYFNISISYRRLTNVTKSLEFGFKSLKLYEELNDKHGVGRNLVNIGNTYRVQKDFDKSLEFLLKALKLNEEIGDKMWIARNLNSIGNLYKDKKEYVKTLEYYSASLKVGKEMKDESRISAATTNLGSVYGLLKQYAKALECDFKALILNKKNGQKVGISECYLNIGRVYLDLSTEQKEIVTANYISGTKLNFLHNAKAYCDSAIETDKDIKHLEGLNWDYKLYTNVLRQMGDYKNAFISYEYYNTLKDSITNGESDRRISQLEKNNEEDLKQKEIEIQKLQLNSAKYERWYFIIGLVLVVIFAGFIFRSLQLTRKQKHLIEEQKVLVDKAYEDLHEKNKEVMDSIHYAKRIQTALITNEKYIANSLNRLMKGN